MYHDISSDERLRRNVVAIGSATAAGMYSQPEPIRIAGLQGTVPCVNVKLANRGLVNGALTLELRSRLASDHKQLHAGALKVQVSVLELKLQVPRGSCSIREIF